MPHGGLKVVGVAGLDASLSGHSGGVRVRGGIARCLCIALADEDRMLRAFAPLIVGSAGETGSMPRSEDFFGGFSCGFSGGFGGGFGGDCSGRVAGGVSEFRGDEAQGFRRRGGGRRGVLQRLRLNKCHARHQ